jgi:hypothetical protein
VQRLIWKIDKLCWSVRYAFQRIYRGYDDRDVFEFYSNFLKRNTKILKDFKKNNTGYPGDLTEDEWDNILQDIIDYLESADEDVAFVDNWSIENQKQSDDYAEQNKNKGFDLLKERFFNLWY